jgi:hypothetical protein
MLRPEWPQENSGDTLLNLMGKIFHIAEISMLSLKMMGKDELPGT